MTEQFLQRFNQLGAWLQAQPDIILDFILFIYFLIT